MWSIKLVLLNSFPLWFITSWSFKFSRGNLWYLQSYVSFVEWRGPDVLVSLSPTVINLNIRTSSTGYSDFESVDSSPGTPTLCLETPPYVQSTTITGTLRVTPTRMFPTFLPLDSSSRRWSYLTENVPLLNNDPTTNCGSPCRLFVPLCPLPLREEGEGRNCRGTSQEMTVLDYLSIDRFLFTLTVSGASQGRLVSSHLNVDPL